MDARDISSQALEDTEKITVLSSGDEVKKGKKTKVQNNLPTYEVKLEKVLGLTVPCNAALDCDSNTGLVAYPAGCTVVLLNERRNRQNHLQNASKKTITCVAFSACGRYLATGECGHQPSVRIWDVAEKTQIAEFCGHNFGVSCVAFSPAHKYLVSVGSQHDMIVNVWDWRGGAKVASNKFSTKVKAISFAENGSYFVTVGNRHVKFWYLDVARGSKFKEPVPLTGRSAILGEQRNNYFCDVACGRGDMGDSTFAITKTGLLCEFNNRRLLDKWVELRTVSANCLVAGKENIFVGCADAIIRCFNPYNLQFITTLPRTHYLGVDVCKGLSMSHMAQHPSNAKYPDTIAVSYDENNHKVTAVYNDHSLYVWDVKDIKRVGKLHSYLYHSACIWGVEICPKADKQILPDGSFITCSSDDTMRVWNIDSTMAANTAYERNIYSEELLKTIYVDPDMNYIRDTDISPQGADKTDGAYDSRNGVRCIKLSSDGRHLASGDRAGNIRIHDLQFMDEICKIEAHDAEVLCLEYSRPETGFNFLSSASRDRLIHVFNVAQDYNFVQTLDDHSSAITSVKFYKSQGSLNMVSCGADRSIIFRSATHSQQNGVAFTRSHNVVGKTTLYDMEVDHGQRHILTACQDRNIRVYNVTSGKQSKTFKGSVGDDGTLIKVALDQSGIYAATSCTDKNMCIYDYYSDECMASMFGHSELVTGIKFTNDGKHLITVSGDGCIFVWSLPRDMTHIMRARLAQQAERADKHTKEQRKAKQQSANMANGSIPSLDGKFLPANKVDLERAANGQDRPDYRFSVGQLPQWAKKQMIEGEQKPKTNGASGQPDMPKGKWAERLHKNPVTFKSHYDTDSVIPFPALEKTPQSGSSKENSLEDSLQKGAPPQPPPRKNSNKQIADGEFVPCPESLREITVGEDAFQPLPRKVNLKRGSPDIRHQHTDDSDVSSLRIDDMATDHDGDIEDYCEHDDESTGPDSSRRAIYYPQNSDSAGDFTVNAMDVEELRRSQRRFRRPRPERLADIPLTSISGSQESEDEDEVNRSESSRVSTPSADTAERNIISMLSMSSENVDRLGRRESFLKNTFESLESDTSRSTKDIKNKNSISYKFNTRRDVTMSSKREELLKKIEETRKKLQSIGYKSTLRSSKSISDLSNIPEKDTSYAVQVHQDGGSGDSGFSSGTSAGGLRRACSLSDLANAGAPRRIMPTPLTASGKKQTGRPAKTTVRSQSNLSRSNSIGMLNQGSEEVVHTRSMRPTISSMNKMTPRAMKRKSNMSLAASTGDIRHLQEDSSSEDMSPSDLNTSRIRGLSSERRNSGLPMRAVSERDLTRSNSLNMKNREGVRGRFVANSGFASRRHQSDVSRPSSACSTSPEEYCNRIDFDSAPLTVSLVESVCEWVVEGCERLSHLWWRTCSENGSDSGSLSDEERHRALRSLLLGAAARANHALSPLTAPSSGVMTSAPVFSNHLNSETKDPRVVAMMQQYTDMLVNMVQQKMTQQTPPGPS